MVGKDVQIIRELSQRLRAEFDVQSLPLTDDMRDALRRLDLAEDRQERQRRSRSGPTANVHAFRRDRRL